MKRIRLGRFQAQAMLVWKPAFWSSLKPEWIGNGYTTACGRFEREPGGFWVSSFQVWRFEVTFYVDTRKEFASKEKKAL